MKFVKAMIILVVGASVLAAGCGGDKKSAESDAKSIVNKVVDKVTNVGLPFDYEGLKKAVYSTNKEERMQIAQKVDKQVKDAVTKYAAKVMSSDFDKLSDSQKKEQLIEHETLNAVGAVADSILKDMPPTYTKIKFKYVDYLIGIKKNVIVNNAPSYEIKGYFDVSELRRFNHDDPDFERRDESRILAYVGDYFHGTYGLDKQLYNVGQKEADFDFDVFKNDIMMSRHTYTRSKPYVFNINISKDLKIVVDFFVMYQRSDRPAGYIGNMNLSVVNRRLHLEGINIRKDSLNENPQFVFKIGNSRTNGNSNAAASTTKKNDNPVAKSADTAADQQGLIAANNILPTFHQAITAKQYQTAFNYLGQEMQNYVGGYDKFVNGYATTISSKVANMNTISSDSNNAVIEYILEAKDQINGAIVEQRFKGKATLKKIDGNWKIVETTAKKISYDTGGSVNSGQTGIITATEVRMRQYNNTNSEILGYFNKGERVTILSNVAGWYKVRRSDNSIGWVLGDFCKPQN